MDRYIYKEKEYFTIFEGKMKDVVTREWIDCVIYVQEETEKVFAREKEEFYKLFKEI